MVVFTLLALLLQGGLSAPAVDTCTSADHRLLILGQVIIRFNITQTLPDESTEMIDFLKGFGADFVFSNLEFAVNGTYAQNNGGFVNDATPHIVDPFVLDVLKTFLIDMWSTANNHAFDLGPAGIISTIEEMNQRNMPYTGTGANITEATQPLILTKDGRTFGLHAVVSAPGLITYGGVANSTSPGANGMILNTTTNVFDATQHALQLNLVEKLCNDTDIALSYHHNHGVASASGYTVPAWMSGYAHEVIDSGATMYIGQGPTNMYPIETYNGQFIFYSTGSFMFQSPKPDNSYPNTTSWEGVVIDVCFAQDTTEIKQIRLIPVLLRSEGEGVPNSTLWYSTVGVPDLCNLTMANQILTGLQVTSAPFGTNITIDTENGIGYIAIPSKEEQMNIPENCKRYKNLDNNDNAAARSVKAEAVVYCALIVVALMSLLML